MQPERTEGRQETLRVSYALQLSDLGDLVYTWVGIE